MSELVAATRPPLPFLLRGGRSFCLAMLAVTILPVLAVPLFGAEPEISGQFDLDILWVIFFFARGHVALTLLLYFD